MGTVLTAAIQISYAAGRWVTEAIFYVGKEYPFMIWISENSEKVHSKSIGRLFKPDESWPDESDDCHNYSIINKELPIFTESSSCYDMLRSSQLTVMGIMGENARVRIITWTDQ